MIFALSSWKNSSSNAKLKSTFEFSTSLPSLSRIENDVITLLSSAPPNSLFTALIESCAIEKS